MEVTMTDLKPGYKTTEFWLTVAVQVLPLLVIFNVLSQPEAETLAQSIEQATQAIAALVAAIVPIWRYVESRKAVKIAEAKNDGR